jgi:hypothetical protein
MRRKRLDCPGPELSGLGFRGISVEVFAPQRECVGVYSAHQAPTNSGTPLKNSTCPHSPQTRVRILRGASLFFAPQRDADRQFASHAMSRSREFALPDFQRFRRSLGSHHRQCPGRAPTGGRSERTPAPHPRRLGRGTRRGRARQRCRHARGLPLALGVPRPSRRQILDQLLQSEAANPCLSFSQTGLLLTAREALDRAAIPGESLN